MRRYYQILGIRENATQEEIKAAWLFMVKAFHPDKFVGSSFQQQQTAQERTKAINEAYSVLSNPVTRSHYDREFARHTRSNAATPNPANSPPPPTPPVTPSTGRVATGTRTIRKAILAAAVLIGALSLGKVFLLSNLKPGAPVVARSPSTRNTESLVPFQTIAPSGPPPRSSREFADEARQLRERLRESLFVWRTNIITTVFWIGERADRNHPVSHVQSCWDPNWAENYGGFDTPDPKSRRNYIPISFIPQQNPFYCALPYNDVTDGQFKLEAHVVIPWFNRAYVEPGLSVCKDRWVAIRKQNRTCYAQWEDCGPVLTDCFRYVFENDRPTKDGEIESPGLEISPAVRDYLGLNSRDVTDWQFVEVRDVPPGPWRNYGENNHFVIARRQMGMQPATSPKR